MINPWKVLGVHRKSTDEEIHQAFIKLAKQYHPDMGGSVSNFTIINEAHLHLKNRASRKFLIDVKFYHSDKCVKCDGQGVSAKSKGLTVKVYTACSTCGGSGFIIKNEENENVIIELRGTVSTGRKGSDKKRRP